MSGSTLSNLISFSRILINSNSSCSVIEDFVTSIIHLFGESGPVFLNISITIFEIQCGAFDIAHHHQCRESAVLSPLVPFKDLSRCNGDYQRNGSTQDDGPHLVPEIATFWFLLLLRSVVFRFVHKMEVNAARISGIGRLVSLSTNRVLSPA